MKPYEDIKIIPGQVWKDTKNGNRLVVIKDVGPIYTEIYSLKSKRTSYSKTERFGAGGVSGGFVLVEDTNKK